MSTLLPSLLAVAPLGTTEMIIIAVLFLIMAVTVVGIVMLVIYLNKKK